ncbi:MAG TPA: gas vesicle protein GvpG [Acidimicrobiales bacterium]|nr:gas vesicle protein GvpG [Acidimicrobiales bacterium]
MGFLTRLVLLPLAPVEGVVWVARQLEARAVEELYGSESIRRRLEDLQAAYDGGAMGEEEFLAAEEDLLDQLDAAMAAERSGVESW